MTDKKMTLIFCNVVLTIIIIISIYRKEVFNLLYLYLVSYIKYTVKKKIVRKLINGIRSFFT